MLRIIENKMWRRVSRPKRAMIKVTTVRIRTRYFLLWSILLFTTILCYLLFTFYVRSVLPLCWFQFAFYVGCFAFTLVPLYFFCWFCFAFTLVPLYSLRWFHFTFWFDFTVVLVTLYFRSAFRKELELLCGRRPFLSLLASVVRFLKIYCFIS
jgi:hypothetical protein